MATNLEFITKVEFTTETLITVDNVFSDKYDTYKIVYFGDTGDSSSDSNIGFRFINTSGTTDTGSNYDWAFEKMLAHAGFQGPKTTGGTFIFCHQQDSSTVGSAFIGYVHNPYDTSSYTFTQTQSSSQLGSNPLVGLKGIGVHKVAQANRGFVIFGYSTTAEGGHISVYGVK
jgi:hypothetical protein